MVDPLIGWCMTYPINYTGHPAISVPAGLTPDRACRSALQIIGRRHADESVLAFASRFEQAADPLPYERRDPSGPGRPAAARDRRRFPAGLRGVPDRRVLGRVQAVPPDRRRFDGTCLAQSRPRVPRSATRGRSTSSPHLGAVPRCHRGAEALGGGSTRWSSSRTRRRACRAPRGESPGPVRSRDHCRADGRLQASAPCL